MPRPSADEAALLKAVCRSPADDTPRLVYADWLDDHGRPDRAEFIRLQVEAAADTAHSGRWDRDARITELLEANLTRWLRDLPKWALTLYDPARGNLPAFTRGFASDWELVAAPFLRYGPQLLDRTPVTAVRLTELKNVVPDLVRCVWLREVPAVDLSLEPVGDAGAAALAEADWLAGTRELWVHYTDIGDRGARALAGCRRLAGVRALGLEGNNLTLAGVRALAESPHLAGVERFRLWGNRHLDGREDEVDRLLGRRAVLT